VEKNLITAQDVMAQAFAYLKPQEGVIEQDEIDILKSWLGYQEPNTDVNPA